MTQERVAYPEWTDYKKKNGLDPLGMQNGSINLYQRLLPGISNVTLRVRYYGLYAWLAAVYARREGHTNLASWQRTIRRAEALYALIASHHQDDAGVAGSRWAGRNRSASTIRFSDNADPGTSGTRYLQQAWGAYGAAYGSQLFETGVLSTAEGHAIPVPSVEFGDALAQTFAEGAGDLTSHYYEAILRGSVTQGELEDFAPLLPSSIGQDSAERQLYEDLLFARGKLQRPADLMVLAAAGSDGKSKTGTFQVLPPSGDTQGSWPRLIGRALAAYFGGNHPALRTLRIDDYYETIPNDILVCWATCMWSIHAVIATCERHREKETLLNSIRKLRERIYRLTGLRQEEFSDPRIARVFEAMNTRFAPRLGLEAGQIEACHARTMKELGVGE